MTSMMIANVNASSALLLMLLILGACFTQGSARRSKKHYKNVARATKALDKALYQCK